MFSNFPTPLRFTAIAVLMAFLSPVANATITVTRAEIQWGDVVVTGRGADANDEIYWEDGFVTTANKRGRFSFESDVVPHDCVGDLRAGLEAENISVPLSNCTPPDSGGGGPIPPLVEHLTQLEAHSGEPVRAVGFVADDGEGNARVISGGEDAYLHTWDLQSLGIPSSQLLDYTIYDLEVSADWSIVATGEGGWNGGPGSDTLRIWDAESLSGSADPIGTTAPIGFVYCVAISPDRNWTVASGFYGDIVVYETDSLTLSATKNTKKKRTKALAFSPDGTILASTSTAGRIQLWSFPELDPLPVSMTHGGSWVFPIAFAPYSTSVMTEIVSGSDGGTLKVWTIDLTETPPVVTVLPIASGAVYSLDFYSPQGPDGPMVQGSMIVAGGDGDITVYDAFSMEILFQTVDAHAGRVNDVAFSPDGSIIASAGADGALKLWVPSAE